MDWLFGCFGGLGKKARKHATSQKVSKQSFQPLPTKIPSPSAIAITGFTARDATNREDLLQETQSRSCLPVNDAEGTISQKNSERTPEKSKKGNPWAQLDDLEEELEDLCKQIEKETFDAKKIKEEVTFLRSCGTLLQTPAELKKNERPLELQQEETPSKGWHSWLVPSSSSPSKLLSIAPQTSYHSHEEGMEAVLHPADGRGAMSPNHQSPIAETQINKADIEQCSVFPRDDYSEIKGAMAMVRDSYSETQGNVTMASTKDNSKVAIPGTKDPLLTCDDYPYDQKGIKLSIAKISVEETEDMIGMSESVKQIHTSVAHVSGSGESVQWRGTAITNFKVNGTPTLFKHRYQMYENSDSASDMVPQSVSSTIESTESSGCQSSSCSDHPSAFDRKLRDEENQDTTKEACVSRNDDSHFDNSTFTSSPSIDSEETLTDLSSTGESFMPSMNPPQTHVESITSCKGEGSSSSSHADETASTSVYSSCSTQNSVAQARKRIAQAERYNNDYCESEDDLSFADSSYHVSAECGHSHTRGRPEESKFSREINQDLIQTPNKMVQWLDTPEAPRPCGVWNRPSSPVLTPVENTLRWRQLKKKETNQEMVQSDEAYDAKSGMHLYFNDKASTYRSVPKYKEEHGRKERCNENEDHGVQRHRECVNTSYKAKVGTLKGVPETEFTPINLSLSNWLTPPQARKGGNIESSTTVGRCSALPTVVNIEAQSSPWTQNHSKNPGEKFMKSSNGAAETSVDISLSSWLHVPSKQDETKNCVMSPAELLPQRYTTQCINDRPILGMISGDINSDSLTRRVHWDGQGIPNTTTKYKEDQRVNWHGSPFEVRLERALSRQGRNLCEAAQRSPVPNRLSSSQ